MEDNFKIEIEDKEVRSKIEKAVQNGADTAPLMAEIANLLYNLTEQAFREQRSIDSTPWQRLSPHTVKQKGHDKILYRLGGMQESLDASHTRDQATVGTNASAKGYPYPAVHQFGSSNGKIKARPFLPLDEADLHPKAKEEIIEMIIDHFTPW